MRLGVETPGGGDEGQGEGDGGTDQEDGVKHREHQKELTERGLTVVCLYGFIGCVKPTSIHGVVCQ